MSSNERPVAADRRSRGQMARRVMSLVLLLCTLLALPQRGAAAKPQDDGCADDQECRKLFLQAKQQYNSHEYQRALESFKGAYERRQTPILLINIGRVLQKLGRPREAMDYYERCKEAAQTDSALQETLDKYMAETRALLGSTPKKEVAEPVEPVPAPVVVSEPVVEKPKDTKPAPTPIYKRWWLWTIVGLAVAGGVTAGVVLGTRPQAPMIDPSVQSFHPQF